jgi:hypothetical protein
VPLGRDVDAQFDDRRHHLDPVVPHPPLVGGKPVGGLVAGREDGVPPALDHDGQAAGDELAGEGVELRHFLPNPQPRDRPRSHPPT